MLDKPTIVNKYLLKMAKPFVNIVEKPIGVGIERACYVHPDDCNKAVKISVKRRDLQSKREIKYYKKLLKRKKVSFKHLPKFYGEVQSNRGDGFVVDLIRDYNGKVSKTLLWYLKKGYSIAEFEPYLFDLKKYFMKNLIIFNYDMMSSNLFFQKLSRKKARLVLIDGLGDTVYIQWFNAFPSHVKSKVERRWGRFIRRLYRGLEVSEQLDTMKKSPDKSFRKLKDGYRRKLKAKRRMKTVYRYL